MCRKMDSVLSSGCGQLTSALLIFLVLFCRTDAECKGLRIFDDNREIDSSSVCLKLYETPDCENFSVSMDQSDLPQDFPRDGQVVEKPSEINLVGIGMTRHNKIYPGISVSWKSPLSETARQNLIGYLIVWYTNTTTKSCRLFHLNRMNTVLAKELKYQYNLLPLASSSTYTVELYSMPCCQKEKTRKHTYVSMFGRTPPSLSITAFGVIPTLWRSFIAYETFDNGTINVRFTLPPRSMNFTSFHVFLVTPLDVHKPVFQDLDYWPQNYIDDNSQGVKTYSVNKSDCYSIWVRANDPPGTRDVLGQCSCWNIRNSRKMCENVCAAASADFCLNVTNVSSTRIYQLETTIVTGASYQVSETVAGGVAGGILLLALVVIFVVIMWKGAKVKSWVYGESKMDDIRILDPPSYEVCSTWCLPPLTKKTVYIMYADDHQFHTQLVEAFVTFLEVHCQCQVITPSHFNSSELAIYEWLIHSITLADYIIFLNSEGAENLILAYLKNKNYIIRSPTLEEEVFRYGFKYLMKNDEAREQNLVFVSFQGRHCQKYLQASENYMLPEHLPHLLQKIHNLNAKNIKAYDNLLPMQVENIPNLPEGTRLIFAVKAVQDYEETNPDWFKNSFGALNLLSNETGYSSGLSSCIGSVSTQDLTLSETSSPASVFDQPHFGKYVHTDLTDNTAAYIRVLAQAQRGTGKIVGQSEQELWETNACADPENLDANTVLNSCVTVYSPQSTEVTKAVNDDSEQKPWSSDEVSIVPPKSLTGTVISNFTEAFAKINNNEESIKYNEINQELIPFDEVSIIPPNSLTGTVISNFTEAFAKINNNEESNDEIKQKPGRFDEVSIVPPKSLTGTVISDLSEAFAKINDSGEFMARSCGPVTNSQFNKSCPELEGTKQTILIPPDTICDLQMNSESSSQEDINTDTENIIFKENTLIV